MDEELHTRLTGHNNIRSFIEKFYDTVQETCRATCKRLRTATKKFRVRQFLGGWMLTAMQKRTNTLRRLYQRTKIKNDLRESRRDQYTTAKTAYQAAIKKRR